jgi:hypothetical protein
MVSPHHTTKIIANELLPVHKDIDALLLIVSKLEN